jgi:hypothetical protein
VKGAKTTTAQKTTTRESNAQKTTTRESNAQKTTNDNIHHEHEQG